MAQFLPALGVAAAVIAGGCAIYANSQLGKLDSLRAAVSQSAGSIDTVVATLGSQTAAVDARIQALRAVAATPEMPVSGAQLQQQIDRLQALQAEAAAIARTNPAAEMRAAAGEVLGTGQAALDALRADPDRDAVGRAAEVAGAVHEIRYELTLRAAVAESEGLATAMAFDPWSQEIDPADYQADSYDAAAVADNITYSTLTAAEKSALRAALVGAEDDGAALQAALDRVAAALEIAPAP